MRRAHMMCLLLGIGAGPLAAAQPNLITNPGFEDGMKGWSFRSPRKGHGDRPVDLAMDKTVAHSGKTSARLTLNFDENAQFYCPVQKIAVFPDTEYMLSAYVKTELESGEIHVELQDVRGWKFLLKGSMRLSGRNDWTKVEVPFRTTLTTEAVRIGLRHVGRAGDKQPVKGKVWWDYVAFVERGSAGPRLSKQELEEAIKNSKLITMENEAAKIAFAEPRLSIRSLVFKKRAELKLLAGPFPEAPLYSIRVKSDDGRVEEVRSIHARSVTTRPAGDGVRLIEATHPDGVRRVVLRAALGKSGWVDLSLDRVETEPGWRVTQIIFPQFITRGVLGRAPRGTFVGGERPVSLVDGVRFGPKVYPTSARIPLMYQFGERGGLYLMALDPDQWVKTLEMQPFAKKAGDVPHSIAWRCSVRVGSQDDLPKFVVRLGPIAHSPYEAAGVYREWAEKQPWCPKPLSQRGDIGSWRLRSVPHYFIYLPEAGPRLLPKHPRDMTREDVQAFFKKHRGRFRLKEVPAVMDALPKEIKDLGGVVDLRGWEKWGLWMNPDWWPPQQGEQTLRSATEAIHKAGLRVTADVMFYNLNIQRPKSDYGFGEEGMQALRKLGLLPALVAMQDEKGNAIYGGAPRYRGAIVCPTSRPAFEHAVQTLRRMKAAGFDDVQFDGGGMEISRPCWNRKHPHPAGEGHWQTEAARTYLDKVRDAIPGARESGFGFVEEYFNEVRLHSYVAVYTRCAQMRHLRARALAMTTDKMAPLPSMFSFVYHGRMIETGFFGSWGPAAYAAAANMALGVCAGPQSTPWLSFRDMLGERWVNILIAGTKARQTFARDYLLLGRMLQPVETGPWTKLTISTKDSKTGKWRNKDLQAPAVIQQAYRSPAGKVGWVLINYTSRRATCIPQRPLPRWFSELASSGSLRKVTSAGQERIPASLARGLTLAPGEVVLLAQE